MTRHPPQSGSGTAPPTGAYADQRDGSGQVCPTPNGPGLTRREYFAGLALQGILANAEALRASPPLVHAERAYAAVLAADALIRALDGPVPTPR